MATVGLSQWLLLDALGCAWMLIWMRHPLPHHPASYVFLDVLVAWPGAIAVVALLF